MEINRKIYDDANKITGVDYEEIGINEDNYYVRDYRIEQLIEDLVYEIDHLNEKIEDMQEDIRDNYRPLTNKDIYED